MSQIKKLNPEHWAKVGAYCEKWHRLARSTEKADRPRAERAVRQLYLRLDMPPPKLFLWYGSPVAAVMAGGSLYFDARLLAQPNANKPLLREIHPPDSIRLTDGAGHSLESPQEDVFQTFHSRFFDMFLHRLSHALWSRIRQSFLGGGTPRMGHRPPFPIRNQDRSHFEIRWGGFYLGPDNQPGGDYWERARMFMTRNILCPLHGHGQYEIQDFLLSVCKFDWCADLGPFLEIAQSCGGWMPFNQVVLMVERPRVLNFDEHGHLHADGKPALRHRDGLDIYMWHGTRIPKEWGTLPRKEWRAELLMQTENAGLRALLIRELGYRQIMEELGSALIDTASRDLPAPPPLPEPILTKLPALANFKHQSKCSMELRRIEVLSDEPIQLLKVECPSTGAAYILRVPPEMTRCEQARAWTMGDEEVTFNAES